MANNENLRPFTGADDPRRQNGRKKGCKNLSTIVAELLEIDVEFVELIDGKIGEYLKNSPTTYAKAIAMAMIIKAINGDVRAATWVSTYADRVPDREGFFNKIEFNFEVIPNRVDLGC